MSGFKPEIAKIEKTFDYLVGPASTLPEEIDVAVVYGRKSRHLAHAAVAVARRAKRVLVTGETGKDSGDNPRFGIPESAYLLSAISLAGVSLENAMADPYHPKNGIDNARNTMRMVRENLGMSAVATMTGVAHSTQVRRLGLTLAAEATRAGIAVDTLTMYASSYPFDAVNEFDQHEVAFEVVRMAQLADEGVFARPEGLDEYLPYATDLLAHHQEAFAAADPPVLNSSTADGTLRHVHPDDLQQMYANNH